jgi:hypothetical protein
MRPLLIAILACACGGASAVEKSAAYGFLFRADEIPILVEAMRTGFTTGDRAAASAVLKPLGIAPDQTWFDNPMFLLGRWGKQPASSKPLAMLEAPRERQTVEWALAHDGHVPIAVVAGDEMTRTVALGVTAQGAFYSVNAGGDDPTEGECFELAAARAEAAKLPILVEMGDARYDSDLRARVRKTAEACPSFARLVAAGALTRVAYERQSRKSDFPCARYQRFQEELARLMPKGKPAKPVDGLVLVDPKGGETRVLHDDPLLAERDWKSLLAGDRPKPFADAAIVQRLGQTFTWALKEDTVHALDLVAADRRPALEAVLRGEGMGLTNTPLRAWGEDMAPNHIEEMDDRGRIYETDAVVGHGDDALYYTFDIAAEAQTVLTCRKIKNAWWIVERSVWHRPPPAKKP